MRCRVILLGLVAVFCLGTVFGADTPTPAFRGDPHSMPGRMKGPGPHGDMGGRGPFGFRLAGFMTAASSTSAAEYLSLADLNAAKELIMACTNDLHDSCADVASPSVGAPMMDWFPYYADAIRCLSDKAAGLSDACKTAAQSANEYMRNNRATLMPALKKVAAVDAYSSFKTACASEISAQCEDVSSLDVLAKVSTVVPPAMDRPQSRPMGGDRHHAGRGDGGFRAGGHPFRRMRHPSDAEGPESQRPTAGDRVTELNAALGTCVSAVQPTASEQCGRSIESLARVAGFVTHAHPGGPSDGRRVLLGAEDEPDAPTTFPESKYPGDKPLHGQPGPGFDEDRASDLSTSEFSGDSSSEDEREGMMRGTGSWRSKGPHYGGSRFHHDKGGAFIGLAMVVSVVVMAVALVRRRRVIRQLTQRVQQLEAAAMARGQPVPPPMPMASPYPGMMYPGVQPVMGMHMPAMPPMPASAPTRAASDATEESSTLLQRSHAPQIVQPYPAQMFYPTTTTHAF